MIASCAELVRLEVALEGPSTGKVAAESAGSPTAPVAAVSATAAPGSPVVPSPFALLPGLGDTACPGFPVDACPEALPDLASHHSLAAEVLRKDEGAIYQKLRLKSTPLGCTFASCIKPAVDCPGKGAAKAVGAFA